MQRLNRPAALLALALLTQCHKDTPAPVPAPEDQLPPATQTGAHTFGCLLNGQVWTPTYQLGSNNYTIVYDPTYAGGDLEIRVYKISKSVNQYFLIGCAKVKQTGVYPLDGVTGGVYYSTGINGPCYEYNNSVSVKGQLTLTKLDLSAGIVSGTFDFKIWQPGCDTVKVTRGRFDYNL